VRALDSSVVVLGLRSLEGDDEFANAMTDALRDASRSVEGWRPLERAVSMAQMSLAYNCEDVNVPCLGDIAAGLQVDRVVFGTVRRTAGKAKFDYEITVSLFNNTTRAVAGTETQTVSRNDSKHARMLSSQAQFMVTRLANADTSAGRLTINVNVLSAEIQMDGQLVGQTQEGHLTIDAATPGTHSVVVSAPGHQSQTQSVSVVAGQQSEVTVNLVRLTQPIEVAAQDTPAAPLEEDIQTGPRSSLAWLGYTLIGVGAASAIGWGASMYMIEFQYNRDTTYQRYKEGYRYTMEDACDVALRGDRGELMAGEFEDFRSMCRSGRTFQTLQWVFLGAAIVSSGLGVYVLVSEQGQSDGAQAAHAHHAYHAYQAHQAKPTAPRLTFDPRVDRHAVALQATLRF
jgi:hypothetical protein